MEPIPQNKKEKLEGLSKLKKIIQESPEKIEQELKRSPQKWTYGFRTRLTLISVEVQLLELKKTIISPENINIINNNFDKLLKRVEDVEKKFDFEIPNEIKAELLKSLSELLDDIK